MPLTIRNITSTQLTLELIERYSATSPPADNSGLLVSAPCLAKTSTSFVRTEVATPLAPFEVVETDIKPHNAAGEIIRLTFSGEGQRYRIEIRQVTRKSQTLTALDVGAKFEFTGLYLPDHTFLAIFSSAQSHRWMSYLKDVTPLSALSIPGTHNSATYHRALPSVRCQVVSPKNQLQNGVRFFDVRVQPDTHNPARLTLVHGAFPISLSGPKHFRGLVNEVLAFLQANPSETVIMSLKREGTGDWTGAYLSRVLFEHYVDGPERDRWYTDPAIPNLGQVRGKIVLMRRFQNSEITRTANGGRGWGIDAECWEDNTIHDNHGNVCVQDFYEVLETVNIAKKIDFCEAHLDRAAACVAHLPGITTDPVHPVPPYPFFLNFLSASNFWRVGCWPDKVAARINPRMVDWLCRYHAQDTAGDGGTGVVICDWVGAGGDWDLVRAILGFNSMLMVRELAFSSVAT